MKVKRSGILIKVILLVLVVFSGIRLMTLRAQIHQARDETAALAAAVDEKTQANAELEYEIAHSEDAETIESIARNKLGLVMPGEKIFFDLNS